MLVHECLVGAAETAATPKRAAWVWQDAIPSKSVRICDICGRFLIGVLPGGALVSARLCRLPEQEVYQPSNRAPTLHSSLNIILNNIVLNNLV